MKTFVDGIVTAILLQEEARKNGVILVWPEDAKRPLIRPIGRAHEEIILSPLGFEGVGPTEKTQSLHMEDLLPKDGYIDVPTPSFDRRPNKYTRAGRAAMAEAKRREK